MTFRDYFGGLEPGQKRDLARTAKTTVGYLHQVAKGHRRAGPNLCRRIERATMCAITRAVLRPDLYA